MNAKFVEIHFWGDVKMITILHSPSRPKGLQLYMEEEEEGGGLSGPPKHKSYYVIYIRPLMAMPLLSRFE